LITGKTKKWLERVDYDLQTADAMLNAGRYIYAVFMCQQAVEKVMKAFINNKGNEVLPIHNLRRLSENSELINELNEEQLTKLDFLSQYYINARYKEDINELSKGITKEFSAGIIVFAKEMIEWVIQKMK
jgi:HEPN domain-containing protein